MRVLLAAFAAGRSRGARGAAVRVGCADPVHCGASRCSLCAPVRAMGLAAVGMAWGSWNIAEALSDRVSHCAGPIEVDLVVQSLPSPSGDAHRFEAELVRGGVCGLDTGDLVRLSWEIEDVPRPGQRWRLTVKAKPARAYVNPHAFRLRALADAPRHRRDGVRRRRDARSGHPRSGVRLQIATARTHPGHGDFPMAASSSH